MVFSSPVFLYLFLPLLLGIYFVVDRNFRNGLLLLASLLFYAWGEQVFVLVMLASIICNYGFGLLVASGSNRKGKQWALALAVVFNLGLLATFKYANFLVDNLNVLFTSINLDPLELAPIHLPIGISFFTFQALSYVIDVYRQETPVQKNPTHLALYIALFPQLIAGPIVRYHDIARQLVERQVTWSGFALGIRRFILGLGKKVLLANTLAVPADAIFTLPGEELTTGLAWLGVLCYTLQIYFDFSGYSDMAVGLGHMFGFTFMENFNYPYISQSIQEFWRRWHISLSTWFRDYLYIPLGGSQVSPGRTYLNLIIVFFLCGLWHGASWNFVIWGLYHGLFLILERLGLSVWLMRLWRPGRYIYVLTVVIVGWVFFRAETLAGAGTMLSALAGVAAGSGLVHNLAIYLDNQVALALITGIVGSTPILPSLVRQYEKLISRPTRWTPWWEGIAQSTGIVALILVLVASSMQLAAGTHNPFIYFRF